MISHHLKSPTLASKEAAPENHTPELLDEMFKFKDPEPVQLDETDEAGEAVQEHLGQEHLNGSFKFRDPEQLNNVSGFQEAALTDTEPKQLVEGSKEREDLRIAYREYIRTRQRIATIEEQLRAHDLLYFVVLPADFFEPQTGVFGTLEELKMLKGLIDGQRANVLHLAEAWSSTKS